jgi:hypothetical protein
MYLLKALILALLCLETGWATSLVERGLSVGYPFGAKHRPGFKYMNINSYISHPSASEEILSKNTYSNVSTFIYNHSKEFFGGQLQAHVAIPSAVFEKGSQTKTWHGGVYNPFAILGLAWDLPKGFSFSNAIGGFAPWNSAPGGYHAWTFVDAFAISHYDPQDHDFTATLFTGFPQAYGFLTPNLDTNSLSDPNFVNLSLTATKIVKNIEFGPIGYFTSDLNSSVIQQQFSLGGLIGFYFDHFYIQAWYGHDTFQRNYQSLHSGGFVRITLEFDKTAQTRAHHPNRCYQGKACQII